MATSPNPIAVSFSILNSMRKRRPQPHGLASVDHSALAPSLDALKMGGVAALPGQRPELAEYRQRMESVDPDTLSRDGSLAFWLNLYNAGALDLAAEAYDAVEETVLRVPGGFTRHWATVGGERLSLHDIEHAKLRRLRDPRIHGALVCGSVSCPTLRYEPFMGESIDTQLEDQMRQFLLGGGAVTQRGANVISLSRVFLWYGADFARPRRMPTWLPVRRKRLLASLRRWLDPATREWVDHNRPAVEFQSYDWSLACSIG